MIAILFFLTLSCSTKDVEGDSGSQKHDIIRDGTWKVKIEQFSNTCSYVDETDPIYFIGAFIYVDEDGYIYLQSENNSITSYFDSGEYIKGVYQVSGGEFYAMDEVFYTDLECAENKYMSSVKSINVSIIDTEYIEMHSEYELFYPDECSGPSQACAHEADLTAFWSAELPF